MSCLCVGRCIQEVKEERLKQYYLDLLREIPLNVDLPSPWLCWECVSLLQRVVAFRDQVKDSYRILQTYTKENFNECLQSDVSRSPRLKLAKQLCIDIPPENVKFAIDEDELTPRNKSFNIDLEHELEEVHTVICDVQRGQGKITNNGGLFFNEDDPMCTQHDVKNEPCDDVFTEKMKIEAVDESNLTLRRERKKLNHKIKRPEVKDYCENGSNEIIEVKIENYEGKVSFRREDISEKNKKDVKISIDENKMEGDNEDTKDKVTDTKCVKNQYYKTVHLSYEEMQAERQKLRCAESFLSSPYKCESCILVYNNQRSLKIHREKRHSVTGKYTCSICDINVSSADEFTSHYRRHMRTSAATHRYHKEKHHSNKPRIECADCDKTFSHRAGLMNHRLTFHEYQNKFPCNVCNKIFRWKTSLKRHLKKHNESKDNRSKAFCAKCDIVFSSVCSLQRHLRNSLKHVTSDQLKFICDHCNHRFADKTKLRDHIEEKHLFRTYQCHICHKPSKNRVGLEQHIRTVHKGRPNNRMCHHCGKGFPVHLNIKSKRYPMCRKRKENNQPDVAVFTLPVHFMPDNGYAI
ncbi:putative zinc finger protein 99 [Danaus plexippus plexippus]|uniref:Zinc finger protein 99 n=1 Tax=Danaus plexippus plexippus TaxID=278856 RepID=A0A212F8F1_DANPL|nr:putative zinc finger protein 99 [Danaus plexippus plexippus]